MGIKKSANEAFIRGLAGKEEKTSQARLLSSPDPLPNEMEKLKKIYFWVIGACIVGLFIPFFLGVGLPGLVILCMMDSCICDNKIQRLRRFKFKLKSDVTNDDIFTVIQPVLMSQYGMTMEKNKNGSTAVITKDYIYDIHINEDNTFTVWWRTTFGKAFRLKGRYKIYRELLTDMGVIAYTVQQNILNSGVSAQTDDTEDYQPEYTTVICKACGATNKLQEGSTSECEFCGAHLNA